ncbi:MAG: PEGA domain-containing protein [Bradymonadales bacterium]|nr:PEGA domain-containing protein [Bradymonadales bacterium]
MARTVLPLLSWLVLLIAPVLAANAQEATIEILSFTEGATVLVDGEPVGTTPVLDPIPVTAGTHVLRVEKRGYLPWEETIEVFEGDELFFDADPFPYAGIVRIVTVEPGAEVQIDGQVAGETPFDQDVTIGVHTIAVSRVEFEAWSVTETITAGQEYFYEVHLLPLATQGTEVVVRQSTPFYRSWWFWSTVGVVVGAGVGTALLLGDDDHAAPVDILIQLP